MELIVAVVLAGTFLAAIVILLGRLAAAAHSRRLEAKAAAKQGDSARPGERSCPLCRSVLAPGERVKSKLFPGKGDRIMHIFGCVHCWPAGVSSPGVSSPGVSSPGVSSPGVSSPSPSAPRICPVCGSVLEAEGWVTARYFESIGRRHVHVLGCANCRKR
jgi:hypothetical protein